MGHGGAGPRSLGLVPGGGRAVACRLLCFVSVTSAFGDCTSFPAFEKLALLLSCVFFHSSMEGRQTSFSKTESPFPFWVPLRSSRSECAGLCERNRGVSDFRLVLTVIVGYSVTVISVNIFFRLGDSQVSRKWEAPVPSLSL